MSSNTDKVLNHFAKSEGSYSRVELLKALYVAMGYSLKGNSIPTEEATFRLTEYLYYKHKETTDTHDPIMPVLRNALQEILKIKDSEVEERVEQLKEIPDAYFPENQNKWTTKLDELIAERVFNDIGPIGIVKIAILKFNDEKTPQPFINDKQCRVFFERQLQLQVNKLNSVLDDLRRSPLSECDRSERIALQLNKVLEGKEELSALNPFKNALRQLNSHDALREHHHQQLEASKRHTASAA